MRNPLVLLLATLLTTVAVVVTLALAAGPKQYQWTGEVTEVDAKAKTMTVKKGDDSWEFSTEGLKDLKAKKGDRVTVFYIAIAKKVEMK
jgi:hypothetical protein